MPTVTPEEMAGKLLAEGFSRSGPDAQALSDPVTDTPMVVTLDDLRPYELDPRLTRNPLYDEIKASILERGLDAPPPITRRPGAEHFIIRNGGNTRLAILRELWSETKAERFFRIPCLFRPWPERGEIVALTGHLAENELHGSLTFIERALGVEKARELYEQESGKSLSQSELARRLSTDGYPIQQSHISRMQDTVRYLLPTIPNVLYNGLGRHQVERLAVLRKACELTWEKHASGKALAVDFETLFHDVLAPFDVQPDSFSASRARDELIGQMSELLDIDYNVLELDIDSTEHRQRAVTSPPQLPVETATVVNLDLQPLHHRASLKEGMLPQVFPELQRTRTPIHRDRQYRNQYLALLLVSMIPTRACRAILSPPPTTPSACKASSTCSPSIPASRCRPSRIGCCRPFRCKPADCSRSATSGTSSRDWTRPIACASTLPNSPRRSPSKPS